MEKSDRPVKESWFGEGEIVDADLLVDLLETFRFGKANLPTGKNRSKETETPPPPPENTTTEVENEADNNESQGNTPISESTLSLFSNPDPILLETPISETSSSNDDSGSNTEPGSNEGVGDNWLESSSTNLPDVENEMQQNAEDGEDAEKGKVQVAEGGEEEEVEEEDGYDENRERSSSELDEKSNLERLLATQENYELYCPSCSSCITREVIVKVRKCEDEVVESSDFVEIKPPLKEVHVPETSDITKSPPQNKPDSERFFTELLKSTVYGGLTETITSLVVVSSASASGSSTENILALVVANLAGGLVVLAQNLYDLRNISDQEKDRYEELLGRRANIRMHILVAVLSYILFGLIPPLVYAFSFNKTGIKNYKLISVFLVSLVCVILLGMTKVYVRKPPSVRGSPKSYLNSATYYTSIVLASSGISYVVGDYVGEYIGKLGLFSLDQIGMTSPIFGANPEEFRFTSFVERRGL